MIASLITFIPGLSKDEKPASAGGARDGRPPSKRYGPPSGDGGPWVVSPTPSGR